MDAPLSAAPAIFAGHFTAKVTATCTLFSITVILLLAGPADEPALPNRFGICALHAFPAFVMLVTEHLYVVRGTTSVSAPRVSIALQYIVNTGTATLPIVVLLYGQQVLHTLQSGAEFAAG